jgi:hypothetical protein
MAEEITRIVEKKKGETKNPYQTKDVDSEVEEEDDQSDTESCQNPDKARKKQLKAENR